MSAVTFDTLKFTDKLKAAGISESQARAEAEAFRDVFIETLETPLATKSNIQDLIHRIDKLQWIVGVLIALSVANFAKQFF